MTIHATGNPSLCDSQFSIQGEIDELAGSPTIVNTSEAWATPENPVETPLRIQAIHEPTYIAKIPYLPLKGRDLAMRVAMAKSLSITFRATDAPSFAMGDDEEITLQTRNAEAVFDPENLSLNLTFKDANPAAMLVNSYYSQEYIREAQTVNTPAGPVFDETLYPVNKLVFTSESGTALKTFYTPTNAKTRHFAANEETAQNGTLLEYATYLDSFHLSRVAFFLTAAESVELVRLAKTGLWQDSAGAFGGCVFRHYGGVEIRPEAPLVVETEGEPIEGGIDLYLTVLGIPHGRAQLTRALA